MKILLFITVFFLSSNVYSEKSEIDGKSMSHDNETAIKNSKVLTEIKESIDAMISQQERVYSLIEKLGSEKDSGVELKNISDNLSLALEKMDDKSQLSIVNANIKRVIDNTTRSRLSFWDNVATIVSSVLSFFAILATIGFGWLTYKLTVKYGESEQEVKDLHLIVDGLQNQREASIEASKPLLKDTVINITPLDQAHTKFRFSITVKNFGLRPAHKVKYQFIFFKLDANGDIESDGKQTSEESSLYQAILLPHEESKKSTENHLTGGFNDLKTVITRFEMNYYDDLKGEYNSYFYFYGFKVSDSGVDISDLPECQKLKIEAYMEKTK